MADDALLEKVHALSDLELAVLLCLISREHCLVSTPAEAIDDLLQELQLVRFAGKRFCLRKHVDHQLTPLHPLGRQEDVRSDVGRRRLHALHHPRRLRRRPPDPPPILPQRPRRPPQQQPPRDRLLLLAHARLLHLIPPPLRLHLVAHRQRRPRQEPRPRAPGCPDPGPRAAAHPPHLHPHVGPDRTQAVPLRARPRGRERGRGPRHAAPQRLLVHCLLARPRRWLRQPGRGRCRKRRRDGFDRERSEEGCHRRDRRASFNFGNSTAPVDSLTVEMLTCLGNRPPWNIEPGGPGRH